MSRRRASRPAPSGPVSRASPPASRTSGLVVAGVAATLVAIVAWVFRPLPGSFFALDDLVMFQQATGVRPWPATAWRWLSGVAWFRIVTPLWGESPAPYHLASLVLHVVNAVLLVRLARRWGASAPAAFLAAGLFAASRLHFPALFAATSIGELLALTFALLALLALAPGRRALLAAVIFALALLSKESVLLVPAAILALPAAGPNLRERARTAAPLLAVGVALGAALLASGLVSGRLAGPAYALGGLAAISLSLARLAGWSLDLARPIPDLHAGAAPLELTLATLAVLALTLLAARWRSAPLVRTGLLWWLLAVLPVLPLAGHLYLHYLYTPLAGLALACAGAFDALASRGRARGRAGTAPRGAWAIAGAIVLAHAALSAALVTQRVTLRMGAADWPLDPVLRKSVIAQRAIADVRRALGGRRTNVAILLPAGTTTTVDLGSGEAVANRTTSRNELEEVLDDGRSLSAFVPNADTVEFVHGYVPGHARFDFFAGEASGDVADLGPPPKADALMAINMGAIGRFGPALDWLDRALADRPGTPVLLYARAIIEERRGDRAGALGTLAELERVAPADSFTALARTVLAPPAAAAR